MTRAAGPCYAWAMADVSPFHEIGPACERAIPHLRAFGKAARAAASAAGLFADAAKARTHHQDRWSLSHIQDGAARTRMRIEAISRAKS